MKKLTPTQIKVLATLGDGLWHSGTVLGKQCDVSRTAIWKNIKQLSELGLSIMSVQKLGYRLSAPFIPLTIEALQHELRQIHFYIPLDIHLFASLHSTNRFLKELSTKPTVIALCSAETQTAGRGRFGRHWHSPFGENIYWSTRWRLNCDVSHLSNLSLVVGLAIINTLNSWTGSKEIAIKWPNDLIFRDQKLCGILIEIIAESHGNADVVIGIGLNVNSSTQNETPIENPWCSVYDITQQYTNRNQLLAEMMQQLHGYITQFMAEGFDAFIDEWHRFDYLMNKKIVVTQTSGPLSGTAKGVTKAGQLILIDHDENKSHYLSSGDTSLQVSNTVHFHTRNT